MSVCDRGFSLRVQDSPFTPRLVRNKMVRPMDKFGHIGDLEITNVLGKL